MESPGTPDFVDPFDSNVVPLPPPARGSLPLRSPAEDCENVPAEPPAIVRGLVVLGSMTEVTAYIRVGKTFFMLMLARATLEGRPFLGCPTQPAFWLWITEEGRPSFVDALRKTRMDQVGPEQMLILHRREARATPWPNLVRNSAIQALKIAAGRPVVLVVDTLSRCAGLGPDQENNAGAAAQVMDPLVDCLVPNLAIVCGRHGRKGGGPVGESGRGSSAFSGEMDILVQLRRPGDTGADDDEPSGPSNVRILTAASRFASTPGQEEKLTIQFADDDYSIAGDAQREERYHDRDEQILLYISSHPGCTKEDIRRTAEILGKADKRIERLTALVLADKVREQPFERRDAAGRTRISPGYSIGPQA